jgi:hypothetical protein
MLDWIGTIVVYHNSMAQISFYLFLIILHVLYFTYHVAYNILYTIQNQYKIHTIQNPYHVALQSPFCVLGNADGDLLRVQAATVPCARSSSLDGLYRGATETHLLPMRELVISITT